LVSFEILVVEIPLRAPVALAGSEPRVARNVMVAAHDSEGRTGWGESCPRRHLTGETVEGAIAGLRTHILPPLLGRTCEDFDAVTQLSARTLDRLGRGQQTAFCAAELALLDLAGQAFGVSAGEAVGPVRCERAEYSGVIAARDPEDVAAHAAVVGGSGGRQVKVMVGPELEQNLRILEQVRDALGDEAELRIDVQGAWDVGEAVRQLEAMTPFRLAGVEQPLPASDLAGLAELTAADIVPVIADESLVTLDDARRLVDRRACHIFNVRVSKVGGLVNAARIHRCARAAGLECQLGAQAGETGLLTAAGRHYATRADPVRWCEVAGQGLIPSVRITAPDLTIDDSGAGAALDRPGLGVSPVADRLDAFTAQRFPVGRTRAGPAWG
jgi:muconate cycloisomerase